MPAYGGLGAVDAVELGRVADRLVHLERHLLGVDHDRRHARRADVGAAAARPPARATRGASALEAEPLDVLPAGLRARAAVARSGSCAAGRRRRVGGGRVDPAAALDELLLDVASLRGDSTLCSRCARTNACAHLHVRAACERLLGAQAELDLVRERRPRTGRARPACGTSPLLRLDRRELPCACRPAGGAREGARAARRVAGALVRRAAGRRRSPRRRRRGRGRRCPRSRRR